MIDQNSQFMAILTNVGAAKLANANALGLPWKLTALGVGDANGTDPVPSATQTKLINERRRAPLNQLTIDPVNPAVIIAEQVIPADVGGWWIREIGLYDEEGDLVAVSNCAPSFKPVLSQGSGRTQIVRMNFVVSSITNVVLKIDPAIVLATRDYVDRSISGVLPEDRKAGTYSVVTINKRGIVVSGSNPTTLAGYGITDGLKIGSGGLLGRPEIVRGNLNAISNTRFFALADDTGDRPPSVRYAAGIHVSFPGGTALDGGIDFAGSVLGKTWFGGRRYSADGTGVWVTFWTSDDFDPANKADKATTLGGYGISDAYTKTQADNAISTAISGKADKANTLGGYGINDAYTKTQVDNAISTAISGKANKATTLGGYGIADAYTKTQADNAISTAVSGKADKATTLVGYGITNAYTSAQVDMALSDKFDKSGGRVSGAVKVSAGGQSVAASGLTVTNADSGAAITSIKLETSLTAAILIHTAGTSGFAVRDALGGYASVDAGDVLSRGSLCHTAASFVKPFAAGWIPLLNITTLPAGGTWAYQMTIYNGNGQALDSRTGIVAGGTTLGTTSSAGFAWKISN